MSKDDFEANDKPRRGRPPTGEGVKLGRVPAELARRVRDFATDNFMTDAEAHRELLERGLNGPKK